MNSFDDIGFSKVDVGRAERNGYPEVIFGQGKTAEQVLAIFSRLIEAHGRAMVTRATSKMAIEVQGVYAEAGYNPVSQILHYGESPQKYKGTVLVLCAGTADIPVAEEAAETAAWMGCEVERIYDVGVAGIDRLLAYREKIREAHILIVVAGMEGALASVVGGMVRRPVIAVPTSVGYGANLQGLTPLLAMLTSCVAGVTVVNIDNGFGAGYSAAMMQQLVLEAGQK